MIKTISYNDFSSFDYTQKNDFEFLLNEFRTFVKAGGNLNLSVLSYDKTVMSLEAWMKSNFSEHPEYFLQLIDEKLIDSPFNFQVDHVNKTITDMEGYGLDWMSRNYDLYKQHIIDSVEKLAIEIKDWDIGSGSKKTGETTYPIYNFYNWDKKLEQEKYKHPLAVITNHLNKAELFNAILSASETYQQLWNDNDITRIIGHRYGRIDNTDIAIIFYDLNMGMKIFNDKENGSSIMHSIISRAIANDNLTFVKKHIKKWNIPAIENKQNFTDIFIPKSISTEMVSLLIENKAFVHGSFKGEDDKDLLCFKEKMHPSVVDTVLATQSAVVKKIQSEPHQFFNFFFKDKYTSDSFEIMKTLIIKYNFPIENYDALMVAYKLNSEVENSFEWFLENGADPRNCEKFISNIVLRRADGLKVLKNLQKNKIFNSFYPDPVYQILGSEPTKDFATFLSKAPDESFTRYTKEGYPAWWGVSNINGLDIVMDKVNDFTQLSSNGLSWFYYVASQKNFKSYQNDYRPDNAIKKFMTKMKKSQHINFDISGSDYLKRNAFHQLFNYDKHSKDTIQVEVLKVILDNTSDSIGKLMLQEDYQGITPLALLINFKKNSNMANAIEGIYIVVQKILNDLDFSKNINIDGVSTSVYDAMKIAIGNRNEHTESFELLDNYYSTWKLHEKLDTELNNNVSSVKKVKL